MDVDENHEVRIGIYHGPVLSKKMIEIIKFDIQMKQHYQNERMNLQIYLPTRQINFNYLSFIFYLNIITLLTGLILILVLAWKEI